MKLSYDLSIEQVQKLKMTPELIQGIQILQFNTQELEHYVQDQILANPVLEMESVDKSDSSDIEFNNDEKLEDRFSENQDNLQEFSGLSYEDWSDYIKEKGYDDISYRQGENKKEDNNYNYEQYTHSDITLHEHLLFQLQFSDLKRSCKAVAKYVIESLDENGYMTLKKKEIAESLGISEKNVEKVVGMIQRFEPLGVCAEDLPQCLLIQLQMMKKRSPLAESIVRYYLTDLAENRINVMAKKIGVGVKDIQKAVDLIKTLEPKPGRQFTSQMETRYIVPDVYVEDINNELIVTINEKSTPRLTVSSYYEKLFKENMGDDKVSEFLSGRLNSALWLIKSIEQRKQTISNVVKEVVKHQKDFFEKGDDYLKPLTLKQIAEEVGIHESTVSRSINEKYMQSPRGLYEIKYFFNSGIAGDKGKEISARSIKSILKKIIDSENATSPYSDQKLVELLEREDIEISRRTVAKYREEMNIPSSSKRKRFH